MKTTDYGDRGASNYAGVDKPAKDVDFAHNPGAALCGTRQPVSDHDIREMVTDFHRVHGFAPSKVCIAEPAGHYKARGITVPLIGICMLDFEYGAEVTHVE